MIKLKRRHPGLQSVLVKKLLRLYCDREIEEKEREREKEEVTYGDCIAPPYR